MTHIFTGRSSINPSALHKEQQPSYLASSTTLAEHSSPNQSTQAKSNKKCNLNSSLIAFPDVQKGRPDPEVLASTRTPCEANWEMK
jgi:hypothetical protein